MKISQKDLHHSRNLLKALGKGKWELDGTEVMAFSDMFKWFASLQKQIEETVALEEAKAKADAEKPAILPIEKKDALTEPEAAPQAIAQPKASRSKKKEKM